MLFSVPHHKKLFVLIFHLLSCSLNQKKHLCVNCLDGWHKNVAFVENVKRFRKKLKTKTCMNILTHVRQKTCLPARSDMAVPAQLELF